MKMNHTFTAALLAGLSGGGFTVKRPTITDGNRVHRDRAPNGSPEAIKRIAAAEAKRARRTAKRLWE